MAQHAPSRRLGCQLTFAVLIPAFNESANLPHVVDELRICCPEASVIVVDDGSEDDTLETLGRLDARWGTRWVRLHENLGTGVAVRAGLRFARLAGHRTVVRLDGDGQHRPSDIARLLAPIVDGEAEAVQGSRYMSADASARSSHRFLASILSRLTGRPVTDPTSGFWAFGPRAVDFLAEYHPSGYPEPELLLLLHRNGLRVAEVPVAMRDRLSGSTSLTPRRLTLAIARLLLTTTIVPLRPPVKVPPS